MQDDIQECTVHSLLTVVLNEAQLPEPVHKEAHTCPRRADDFRQALSLMPHLLATDLVRHHDQHSPEDRLLKD